MLKSKMSPTMGNRYLVNTVVDKRESIVADKLVSNLGLRNSVKT